MADPRSDAQLLGTVEAFVLRARRVLAHSLCEDEEGLTYLADGAWFAKRQDGVESISRQLPAEETVESLAARVRPLILQRDPVHYGTVLKALGSYLTRHGHPEQAAWCRQLRKDWESVDLASGEAGYFLSVTQVDSDDEPVEITDLGLAGTWFYGDLLHADATQIDRGKAFEIDQRFAAAAVRVAQLSILARDTLSFVRSLIEDNVIEIGEEALSDLPVKVESKDIEGATFFSAPVGTENPGPAGSALSEEWKSALPGTEDGQWVMRIPWGRPDA
jgi:hypothetical protein